VSERQPEEFDAGQDRLASAGRLRAWLSQQATSAIEIIEGPRGRHPAEPGALAGEDASGLLTALYDQHYASLVRQAWLLTRDMATAEHVVQDSFVAVHASWHRLRDSERALCYLRQCVMSRSRSAGRRRPPGAEGPAEYGPLLRALGALPVRQREALVMRCYANLSEAETAGVMRISERAVRQQTTRGLASLHTAVDAAGHAAGLLVAS
jgi:DNA-directed RNA polymerase specialized sigma24 family protein